MSELRCVDVHKAYRSSGEAVPALRGVDLTVEDPGFYAIMGQSGSGKTTLLHLMAALDRPDQGEIWIGDKAIHTLEDQAATRFRRREIGIVFQQFNLIATLTAKENIELPGMLSGDDADTLSQRSAELLDQLGIGKRSGHRPDALSGGEQQRVAIARALLYKPRVVLADEPTGNLDSASSERLWGLLAEIASEHAITVLMVTHEPAAAAHCRSTFIIKDGRMTDTIETEGLDAAGVAARYQQSVGAA